MPALRGTVGTTTVTLDNELSTRYLGEKAGVRSVRGSNAAVTSTDR
jgi:hypothetical protein